MHSGTQPCKKVDSQFPANSTPLSPAPSPSLPGGLQESFWEAHKSAPRWESDGNGACSVPQKREAAGSTPAPRGPWDGAAGGDAAGAAGYPHCPSLGCPSLGSQPCSKNPARRGGAPWPTLHLAEPSEGSPSVVQIPNSHLPAGMCRQGILPAFTSPRCSRENRCFGGSRKSVGRGRAQKWILAVP